MFGVYTAPVHLFILQYPVQDPLKDLTWLWIIIGLVLALLLLILAFAGLINLRRYLAMNASNPVLKQFIDQVIIVAYKSSDAVFDVLGDRLHGVDKRGIAASMYDTILPDVIKIPFLPLEIKWKQYVSKDQFMDFVETEYNKMTEGFKTVQDTILKEMLDAMSEGT